MFKYKLLYRFTIYQRTVNTGKTFEKQLVKVTKNNNPTLILDIKKSGYKKKYYSFHNRLSLFRNREENKFIPSRIIPFLYRKKHWLARSTLPFQCLILPRLNLLLLP